MPVKRTKRAVSASPVPEMQLQGLEKIVVMLSSRNVDPISYHGATATLSDVRSDCATEINATEIYGARVFDTWINEHAVEDAQHTTETCLERVGLADIVIVLYNGRAGWAVNEGGVGICHAELARAMECPAKVFIVELPVAESNEESAERDARFRQYVASISPWRRKAENGETAIFRVKEALVHAFTRMVHRGVREARRGAGILGEALDWEKLGLEERGQRMTASATEFLSALPFAEESDGDDIVLTLSGTPVQCVVHAIPEALSYPPARELVGQVFQSDHVTLPEGDSPIVGPVHLLLVHRNATRTQARKLLGVDDSTCFDTPFGIFVADELQKIQILVISKCADDTSTRQGLQKWLDWMNDAFEEATIADRANRRATIVRAIQRANES